VKTHTPCRLFGLVARSQLLCWFLKALCGSLVKIFRQLGVICVLRGALCVAAVFCTLLLALLFPVSSLL
jgi:hypothetical protein